MPRRRLARAPSTRSGQADRDLAGVDLIPRSIENSGYLCRSSSSPEDAPRIPGSRRERNACENHRVTSSSERLRLRISLLDSDPEIWRTIDLDGSLRLDEVHDAIQIVFGWRDTHLHEFDELDPYPVSRELPRIGRRPRRWMPATEIDGFSGEVFPGAIEYELIDEVDATIATAFDTLDGPLFYAYDFGDDWQHSIELIERERADAAGAEPRARRAELVHGERRGPLEDSGGAPGYAELLERLADTASDGHREVADWTRWVAWPEAAFDPDAFDAEGIDHELALRFEMSSDVSGLVADEPRALGATGRAAASVALNAPIVELLARLPDAARRELRLRLHRTGALKPIELDEAVAERMSRPFIWLLGRIDDGLALTKAGWMPPAVVLEGMTVLGWAEDWHGESNREDITRPPIRSLRQHATRLGLVRVLKGRLLVTVLGRRLRDDPLALWQYLASALVTRPKHASERDTALLLAVELACGGHHNVRHLEAAIASGLDALGWRMADGDMIGPLDAMSMTLDTTSVLTSLGALRGKRWNDGRPAENGIIFARMMLGGVTTCAQTP